MPIKTDKIYNRDSNNYVDTDFLLKFNPDDNTIRTLLDDILIDIDALQGLNVTDIDALVNEWTIKIKDITDQYNKIYAMLQKLTDVDIIDDFNKKVDEINKKLDDAQKNLEQRIKDLENQNTKIQNNIDDLNNNIDDTNKKIDMILNPTEANTIAKIYKLINLIQYAKSNLIKTYSNNKQLVSSNTTITLKIPRGVFLSGKTHLRYGFADTETTNYFDLINPKTGKSKRFDDSGAPKTSGSNVGYVDKWNQDLRYMVENQDGDTIEAQFKVYMRDVKRWGWLFMEADGVQREWSYSGKLTNSRGTTTKRVNIPRGVFSKNVDMRYGFTDTETTNWFQMINPKTGKNKQWGDCGRSSGQSVSYCNPTGQDLSYLLDGWDGQDTIGVDFKVYQGDSAGFGWLDFKNKDYSQNASIIYLHNKNSYIVDITKVDDFTSNFQAQAVCDMYERNYPYEGPNIRVGDGGGDPRKNYYVGTSEFYIKNLDAYKYEVGILTYDLENNETASFLLTDGTTTIDIPTGKASAGIKLDFKLVENGVSLHNKNDEISSVYKNDGWELFCPHSKDEYEQARKYLVSIGKPTKMGPLGIYGDKAGNYSNHALKSDDIGKLGWHIKDGNSTWWASDRTDITEPNGDYTPGNYLDITYDNNGNITHYNDTTSGTSYTSYLLVKRTQKSGDDNYKETVIKGNDPSQTWKWRIYNIDTSKLKNPKDAKLIIKNVNGYFEIDDFYFRKLSYNKVYEFKKDSDEIVDVKFHHSVSKLPIMQMAKNGNDTWYYIPNKNLIANGSPQFQDSGYMEFKPIKNEFYKITAIFTLSGSWDNEEYIIKINGRNIFSDKAKFSSYNPNYKVPFISFVENNYIISNWSSSKSVSKNNKDMEVHLDYTDYINTQTRLSIYNGVNQEIADELLALKDIKIEKINNLIIEKNFDYSNTWKGLEGFATKNRIETDYLQALVFNKSGKLSFKQDLIKNKRYYLQIKLFTKKNNSSDKITIKNNNKTLFSESLYSSNVKNSLNKNYTSNKILSVAKFKNVMSTDRINNIFDSTKFNAIKNQELTEITYKIPFVADDKNNFEIDVTSSDYFGIEYIIIYEDLNDYKAVISNNVNRIESGENDNWQSYGDNGITIKIDTSDLGFGKNVKYFASLYGDSGNWQAIGETAIYNASSTGFQVYIYHPSVKDLLSYAKSHKWKLVWTAVDGNY